MSQYLDIVIVSVLVLAASAYLARKYWRRWRGKGACCGGEQKRANLTLSGKPLK